MLGEDEILVDHVLYWISCRDIEEANYLLAIINSVALYNAVSGMMPKGQFGARHLHKHLWKLPIPEFDPSKELHTTIAEAGATAATSAGKKLEELRERRGDKLTVTIARRELRHWLRTSDEGKSVEDSVTKLLVGG